jgi:hypothetical protein
VAEGEKVARRLLESEFPVISVLLPEKWLPEFEPLLAARPENIQVFVVRGKDVLEKTGRLLNVPRRDGGRQNSRADVAARLCWNGRRTAIIRGR